MDGAAFGQAIARFEEIIERLNKVISYAQLVFAGNMSDPGRGRFLQTMQERYNAIYAEMLFFTLEINRIEDDVLEAKLSDPVAARYRPWLRDTRVFRPYQLSDELEKLLHDKAVTGAASWVRLFDRTMADLRFPVDGKTLTLADTLNMLDNNDSGVRRTGAKALGQVFGENIEVFSLITNTLAKDKEIEDKWRGYPHPVSERNLSNKVEDEVVDALVGSIRDAYGELAHRYYALKAGWFGTGSAGLLGSQRPAAGRGRPRVYLGRGPGDRARRVRPVRSRHRRDRRDLLRTGMDRRRDPAGQGLGRFLPSRRSVGPSLCPAQFLRPAARRGDAGP